MAADENATTFRNYIQAMDDNDYPAALSAFAADALYIHPPLPAPGSAPGVMGPPGSVISRGRDEIADLFRRRGTYPTDHVLHTVVSLGDEVFAEGQVTLAGLTTAAVLLHATFNGSGLIERYIAMK